MRRHRNPSQPQAESAHPSPLLVVMQRTVVALLRDHPGALNRAVSLFRRRAFNIHSLAVGASESAGLSRMTVVVAHDDVRAVVQQLSRLIDVVDARDVTDQEPIEIELCLVRMTAAGVHRTAAVAVAQEFGARVVEATPAGLVLVVAASADAVSAMLTHLAPFGVEEFTRSGALAIAAHAPPAPWAHASARPGGARATARQATPPVAASPCWTMPCSSAGANYRVQADGYSASDEAA